MGRLSKGFVALVAIGLGLGLGATGCGWIADQDRIVVAKVDDKVIRRGDLKRIIRRMTDEERPLVQNRGDLLRTLNKHIDDKIKSTLAKELKAQGKIEVPREVAREAYFRKYPENRGIFAIQDASVMDLTEQDLVAMRADVEFGIDDEEERLLRQQAVAYRVRQAVKAGTVAITEEDFAREYAMRKNDLRHFEHIEFLGLRFPAAMPGAVEEAAKVRDRVDLGERFEAVVEWYRSRNPDLALRSGFDNDPSSEKFQTFWSVATGCKEGDVLGPVYLPQYELLAVGSDGRTARAVQMPAAHLVFKVLEHAPERHKALEEAKRDLEPFILMRKMVERLREEHGVEVYEDKLPNPEGFGDQFKEFFIRTD